MTSIASKLSAYINGITECPVCLREFDDPRSLSCLHTFCIECLRQLSDRCSSDSLDCPLCRTPTIVPDDGVEAFRRNFFISGLLDARRMANGAVEAQISTGSGGELECVACRDEFASRTATVYCRDCDHVLCDRCGSIHAKLRPRPHEVEQIPASADDQTGSSPLERLRRRRKVYCKVHEGEALSLYCDQCREVICQVCRAANHGHHDCREVEKSAEQFEELIRHEVAELELVVARKKATAERLEALKEDFLEKIKATDADIDKQATRLKEIIDGHARDLKRQLDEAKKKLEYCDVQVENVQVDLVQLGSVVNFARELLGVGTACDISRAAGHLVSQAREFIATKSECAIDDAWTLDLPRFVESGRHRMMVDEGPSFVGNLVVEKRNRESRDATGTGNEVRPEMNKDNPMQGALALNGQTSGGGFKDLNKSGSGSKNPPGTQVQRSNSTEFLNDFQIIDSFPLHPRLLKTPESVSGVAQLGDRIYVTCNNSDLIHVFQVNSSGSNQLREIHVSGLANPQDMVACAGDLFVADWPCGRWENARMDEFLFKDRGRIWRIRAVEETAVKCITSRSDGDKCLRPHALSASCSNRLLVVSKNDLLVYLCAGESCRQLRCIPLRSFASNNQVPWHAVETPSDTYVVCFGFVKEFLVAEVNARGEHLRTSGEKFLGPCHLAVYDNSQLIVAACNQRRSGSSSSGRRGGGQSVVLLLKPDLSREHQLLTETVGQLTNRPRRLCYVGSSGRLLVGMGGTGVSVFEMALLLPPGDGCA